MIMKLKAIFRILFCKNFLLISGSGENKKSICMYDTKEIVQSGNAIYIIDTTPVGIEQSRIQKGRADYGVYS